MSEDIRHLRILIASPNDVKEERSVIKPIVDNLNITNQSGFQIHLDVIGWEKNFFPSMGEDAQDVINTQLDDDYDIFLGIMWGRFGSPTKRDESGTKEEFERAYNRWTEDNKSVYIMFFFKDAPIQPSKMDLLQIQNVLNFKESLGDKGLYATFTNTDEFEELVRLHLQQVVLNFYKNKSEVKDPKKEVAIESNESNDIGYFEHLQLAENKMQDVNSILNKLTMYSNDLTEGMEKSQKELENVNSKPEGLQQGEMIRIIDSFGNVLINYSNRVDVEMPILSRNFSEVFDHFREATDIINLYYQDQNVDEIESTLDVFDELKDSMLEGANQLVGLKDVIDTFPPLTDKLAKAKRLSTRTLNNLVNELNSQSNVLQEIVENTRTK